jgi:DNA invertase Pin-like site-specific DNA recombinase
MNDKISATHLERAAYVFIRQSSLQQVRHNLESSRRQYALQDRARELGFEEVVVICASPEPGHHERPGFGRLLGAVCDGRVGAVLAMEASRLARNNRDWHHLIDLCVLTQTLLVDRGGDIRSPPAQRPTAAWIEGHMSEFELGILRQRAQEAYRQKVLRGEVLTKVPIGFIRSHSNRVEMTPDREVQEAIRGSSAISNVLVRCARCSYGITRKTLQFRLRASVRACREQCGGCPIISICYECSKIQPTLGRSLMAGLNADRWPAEASSGSTEEGAGHRLDPLRNRKRRLIARRPTNPTCASELIGN